MISWIRIDREIGDDPKVYQLADAAKIDPDAAIGKLVRLFGEMAEHAKDGDLSAVPDAALEDWANWRGKRGVFAVAFRQVFAPDGVVSAWAKHNGAAIEKAERDARRVAERRAAAAEKSRNRRATVARRSRDNRASVAGDVDVSLRTTPAAAEQPAAAAAEATPAEPPKPTVQRGGWVGEFVVMWQDARSGDIAPGRVGKALNKLVGRLGLDVVRPAWAAFLASEKAQYGPEYFAANVGLFRPKPAAVLRSASGAPMQTLDEIAAMNRAELETINRSRAERGEPVLRYEDVYAA